MNKKKFLYLSGVLISDLGSNLFLIAIIVWLKQVYDKSSFIGIFLFTSSIAGLISSPLMGVWTDRLKPKTMMILTDIGNGLIMFTLSALIAGLIKSQHVYLLVVGLAFVSAIMGTAFSSASLSLVGLISSKSEVKSLTSLTSNINESSRILGRTLGAVLIAMVSPALLIFINGVSFLLSAFFTSQIEVQVDERPRNHTRISYFSQLAEGFHFLKQNSTLLVLFFGAASTNFFLSLGSPIMPMIIEDLLGKNLSWYGFVMSATGVGALAGGFLARKVREESWKKYFSLALLFQGIPLLFIPLATHPMQLFLLNMFVGLAYVFVQVHMLTLVTNLVPQSLRGRVFSLMFAIVGLFMPLGYIVSGVLGDLLRTKAIQLYLLAGAGICLVWLIALCVLNKQQHHEVLEQGASRV